MGIFGKKQTDKTLEIVDKLVVDQDKKTAIAAKVIENEHIKGGLYTSFARPTIVYVGLFVILMEIFGLRLLILDKVDNPDLLKYSNAMMEYFLFTWAGVVSIYVGGRSYEKKKMNMFKKSVK